VGGSAFAVPRLLEVVTAALGWGGEVDGAGWLGGVLVLLTTAPAAFAARKAASTSSSSGSGGWTSAGRLTSGLALTKAAVASRVFVRPGLVEAAAAPGLGVLAGDAGWLPSGPGLVGAAVWLAPGWVGLVGGAGRVTARPGLVGAAVWVGLGWAVAVGRGLVGTAVWLPFVCVGLARAVGRAGAVGPGLVGTAVWLLPDWVGFLVGGVGLVGEVG